MTRDEARAVVRGVLDQLTVEGSDFYHNEPNDYGVITGRLFVGQGNPWEKYRGEALTSVYGSGEGERRPNGYYKLNDALVDKIVDELALPVESVLPPGWRIEDVSEKPFKAYAVFAPSGAAAVAYSHERNPSNVLFQLADALCKKGPR